MNRAYHTHKPTCMLWVYMHQMVYIYTYVCLHKLLEWKNRPTFLSWTENVLRPLQQFQAFSLLLRFATCQRSPVPSSDTSKDNWPFSMILEKVLAKVSFSKLQSCLSMNQNIPTPKHQEPFKKKKVSETILPILCSMTMAPRSWSPK